MAEAASTDGRTPAHGFRQWDSPHPLKNVLSSTKYTERVSAEIAATGERSVNAEFCTFVLPDACLDVLWRYLSEEALPELQRRSDEVNSSCAGQGDWVQQELARSQSSFWLRKVRNTSPSDKIVASQLGAFERLAETLEEQGFDVSQSNVEFRLDTVDLLLDNADGSESNLGGYLYNYSADKKRRRWHKDAEGTSRMLCTLYGIRTPYVEVGVETWIPQLPEDCEKTYEHRDTYESVVVADSVYAGQPVLHAYGGKPSYSPTVFFSEKAPGDCDGSTSPGVGIGGGCSAVHCIMNSVILGDGTRHQLLHGFVTAEEIDGTPPVTLFGKKYKRIFMMLDGVRER